MKHSNIMTAVVLFALAAPLAACGTTPGDRVASGAGLGAATGAGVGALTGGSIGGGALIGGAVGGLAGGATRSDQVNLGKPVWR